MGSDHSPTSSPRRQGQKKSILVRAIAEHRITGSATYIPQDHPLNQHAIIPELPHSRELPNSQENLRGHNIRNTTLSQEDSATVYNPYTSRCSVFFTEKIHTTMISPVDKSDFVMLYLMIGGPPFFTKRQASLPPSSLEINRAWSSMTYRAPEVRKKRRHMGLWNPLVSEFQKTRILSDVEVYNTDLRGVAAAVPLRWTQTTFWDYLRSLYPPQMLSENYVAKWTIECSVCGEEVDGYTSDPLWKGRYIHHKENNCIASEECKRENL